MNDTPQKRVAETSAAVPGVAGLTFATGRDKLTIPLQGTNLLIMIGILWQLLGSYKDLPDQVEQIAEDVSEIRTNDQEQATQIGKLEAQVETLEDDRDDLKDQVKDLEKEIERLKAIKDPGESVSEMEAELKRLKKCIADGSC